jgi:hypothetical protein
MQDTQLLADSICRVIQQPKTSCSAQHMQQHAPTKPLIGHHTGAMELAQPSDLDAASTHQQRSSTAVFSKAQAAAVGQPISCCEPCPMAHANKLPPGTDCRKTAAGHRGWHHHKLSGSSCCRAAVRLPCWAVQACQHIVHPNQGLSMHQQQARDSTPGCLAAVQYSHTADRQALGQCRCQHILGKCCCQQGQHVGQLC